MSGDRWAVAACLAGIFAGLLAAWQIGKGDAFWWVPECSLAAGVLVIVAAGLGFLYVLVRREVGR